VKAELAQQQAVLAELSAGPRQETIAAMMAESEAWAADVELRLATFNRIDGLFKRNATSAQSVDEAKLNWKSASARRDAVNRQLEELQAGTRDEKLTAQTAVVAGLKARLASLQIDVDDSDLKAPFAGTIVSRNADDGDMLSPQQSVFELLETGHYEARIGIPSSLVGELSSEGYYVLTAGSVEVTGKVRSVLAQVDQSTRTQTVVLDIDAANAVDLADGQLVRMGFDVPIDVDGFEVPLTALASGSRGLWTVYVMQPVADFPSQQTIAARSVEVLHTDGSKVVIRGAIYEGESLVVEGVHRVVPGQLVTNLASSESSDSKANLGGG
jgi:multidrug efflux pump subunit AcrA (membrane-fusion protein)